MYLLDTNVVSEARRGTRRAVDWLRSVRPDTLHLSVVTLGEIARGISLKERTDARTAAVLRTWLQTLRHDHAARLLPITDAIALEWGRIGSLRPRGDADGLIAATALVHGLVLVTRNVSDFADLDLPLIDPWADA
jgi:hypothetical protein